jgi:predicted flap endonuclease-1-like 5' DNA nuclease/predicted  nucleic acid-binding Zn-ribbon protein
LLLGLLLPFLLGYLVRRFIDLDKRDQFAKLETEHQNLQGELAKSLPFKSNWHHAESENKKLLTTATKNENEIKKLNADLAAANNKYKPYLGVDLEALREKIASLEKENAGLHSSINEMSGAASSLEDVQSNANAMKERFSYLESENVRLKIDLKSAIAAKDSIERANDNVRKMKDEIRDMSGRIGGYTMESERLKKEASEATAKANAANTELNDLKTKIASSQDDGAKNAVAASEYQMKINALQHDLDVQSAKAKETAQLEASLNEIKTKLTATEIDLSSARLKQESAEKELESIKAVKPAVTEPIAPEQAVDAKQNTETESGTVVATPVSTTPDDLKIIEGIGPKVEILFNEKGIYSFSQLASMDAAAVQEILDGGGANFRILNGNSWPKQAALLRDGKLAEFEKYTDYLIAGVDPAEVKHKEGIKIDDLKIVEGIGPKIEQILNQSGMYSFDQLANAAANDIKEILVNAGSRFQMHDPTSWPQQAALARDGKMEDLKKLQDELSGGRL